MTYDELADYCKEASNEIIRQDEEIRQLKKQLENNSKEFIKWLEDEIQKKREKTTTLTSFIRNVVPLKQCLQKYKSIIGDDK